MHNLNFFRLMEKRFFVKYCLLLVATLLLSNHLFAQNQLFKAEIEAKVDSVLSLMTVFEKVGQLNQHNGSWEFTGPVPDGDYQQERFELLKRGGVGTMLNVNGAEATRAAQKIVMENSRLKIPLIFGYDVIHGYKTMFPIPLGEAASWDLEAIENNSRIAAIEASAAGINWTFAPMMDVTRDPRWGRGMEGAGEDPYLSSLVSVARVKGFQTNDLSANNSIAATAKHLAAYGFSESGRDYNTVDVSKNTLLNVILPPFKAVSDAGVASMMNSFNDLWAIPTTASHYLHRDLLKGDWGFKGMVVSDWGSIRQMVTHGYSKDLEMATKQAIIAGNDIDMESEGFQRHLVALVESGEVPMAVLDDAVKRVLRIKFLLGVFDDPYRYSDVAREKAFTYTKEHRMAAREAAKKSIVLLKNENNVLPFDPTKKATIAVIGKLANDKDTPIGSWRGKAEANSAVSLLEGIKAAVGKNVTVKYAPGYVLAVGDRTFIHELTFGEDDGSGFEEALKIAKEADYVIMAVGEEGFQSGEGRSQVDVSLKGRQVELMNKVLAVNKNTAIVLMNGRAIVEPDLYNNPPAVLETWHLGSEAGNAISDVLFGKYNPSGKMPMTIPRHAGQIPIYYNHKSSGRPTTGPNDTGLVFWSHFTDESNDPQYPFGYGLSYTTFSYSDVKLSAESMGMDDEVTLSVTLTNTGKMDGEEVVQFYIRDHYGSTIRPVKELKGFQKVFLKAGESKVVDFKITAETLAAYVADDTFKAEPGAFTFMVGTNAMDVQKVSFMLNEN